jgi:hypothetical protein
MDPSNNERNDIMQFSFKSIGLMLTLFASFFIGYHSVFSQSFNFGLKPENPQISYFEYTVNPGDSVEDAVIATNSSNVKMMMTVLPVDGQTAINGGVSFDYNATSGPSKWITFEKETSFELKPFHIMRMPFKVTVPSGTKPGYYVAGFLASAELEDPTQTPTNTENSNNGMSVAIINRVGVAVIIHVPGEETCQVNVKSMTTSISDGKWMFTINLKNDGNVPVAGNGKITIQPLDNQDYSQSNDWQIRYFIPGTELISYSSFVIPPQGNYKLALSLTDSKRTTCQLDYSEDVSFGIQEQQRFATQATVMAQITKVIPATVTALPTNAVISQVRTPGTSYWYIWLSAVVLLISVGFVIYALSILKKNKK